MCIDHCDAAAEPPLSFTTCLITVSVGATSLFVIVQVLCSPSARLTAPEVLQSPAMPIWVYPLGPPDSLTTYEPALSVRVVPASEPAKGLPLTSLPPLVMCIDHCDAVAEPPLSFTTCLMTVSVGPTSLFVTVQVLASPRANETLPFASHAPENDAAYAAGPPVSLTLYEPALTWPLECGVAASVRLKASL